MAGPLRSLAEVETRLRAPQAEAIPEASREIYLIMGRRPDRLRIRQGRKQGSPQGMAKQDAELPLSDKHFLAPYSYATLPMNKTDPSGHAIYLVDVFGTDDDYRKVITLVTGAVERPWTSPRRDVASLTRKP